MGTLVFLEETQDNENDDNVCKKQTPINLEVIAKSTKQINLKWLQIPDQIIEVPHDQLVDVKYDEEYKDVLAKLKEGTLNIEDIVVQRKVEAPLKNPSKLSENAQKPGNTELVDSKKEKSKLKHSNAGHSKQQNSDQENSKLEKSNVEYQKLEKFNIDNLKLENLNSEYSEGAKSSCGNLEKGECSQRVNKSRSKTEQDIRDKKAEILLKLAKIPIMTKQPPESVLEPKEHLITPEKTSNINVLKQLYLQSLSYKEVETRIDLSNIENHVDIENSIRERVLKPREELLISKDSNLLLSEEERNSVISLDNFHNLSLPLQLALLVSQLKVEKEHLTTLSSEEMCLVDEYGRTARDRYRILKSFAKDLWYMMFLKLRDKD